jgi:ATP-binding protein involved in chromosome partitioning
MTTSDESGGAAGGAFGELGPLPGVRDIIAVASTKGGVGKSTVAVNLALAFGRLNRRVGLLDADVYGPSLPIMFGLAGRPRVADNKRICPLEKYGLRLMSIGFFLDDSSPVIWRGPLVMGLVRQFLKDVEWGELDVLVVDMPPGTGDAQLTLVQQVPLAGGVVVTTPQDVATLDVQRGIAMFQQVHIPVLGIIENMSYYECPHCGRREDLFGTGGGERIADRFGVPLLAQIPLVPDVRQGGDEGKPLVADRPDHPVSQLFVQVAGKLLEAIEVERLAAAPPTIIG